MRCTGNCSNCRICSVKITNDFLLEKNKGNLEENKGKLGEISPNSEELTPEEEKGASEAFDRPVTDLAVVDRVEYEVKKNIFGKDVVKKVR